MAGFWLEWQLWMKLVFLLACGIVVTVATALLKVAFLRHKYSKLVIEVKKDTSHEHTEAGYLFGAPALERGFVVEGIWTPHSNTPESSRETLHRTSSELVLLDARHTVSRVHTPGRTAVMHYTPDQHSSCAVIEGCSDSSIALGHTDADQAEHELPQSGLALNTTSYSLFMLQHPDFVQAMEDIDREYQAAAAPNRETAQHAIRRARAKGAPQSSDDPRLRRASDTVVRQSTTEGDALPLASRHSSDLSMLDRQRHKLAAETGQFVQRRMRK